MTDIQLSQCKNQQKNVFKSPKCHSLSDNRVEESNAGVRIFTGSSKTAVGACTV